jgi:site-specific DNA-methyltransferase (adenine-specific)
MHLGTQISKIVQRCSRQAAANYRLAACAPQKLNARATFCLYETDNPAHSQLVIKFDLRQQDCIDGMSRLTNESVDLVVTSPPYNLGIRYGEYADRQDRQSYLNWCAQWAAQIRRILRSNGSFFLNVGAAPSNPMLPHQIVIELTASGEFVLQNTIHWIKSITIDTKRSDPDVDPLSAPPSRDPNPDAKRQMKVDGGAKTFGHFKPINSKRFLNDCHEYIFHFTKSGRVEIDRLALGVPYQDKSNIARWSHTRGSDLRCRGNTWFIPYETIQSRAKERPHPATFPVQLAEWCIKLHGVSRVHTMLDPFLGIGNSALAAKRCGVKRFIGFEIDETYLAEAKQRLQALQSSRA